MRLHLLSIVFITLSFNSPKVFSSGDLDHQAWLAVVERLSAYLPDTGDYKVHFPPSQMFATWHIDSQEDASKNLNQIAGTIPPWGPGWQIGGGSFADRYGEIVDAVDFPPAPEINPKKKKKVLKDYDDARKALDAATAELRKKLDEEWEYRKKHNQPFTFQQQLEWWTKNGKSLIVPSEIYDDAANELRKIVDPNWSLRDAWDKIYSARKSVAQNFQAPGLLPYVGNVEQLKAHVLAGKQAETTKNCITGWVFNQDTKANETSKGGWGAGASYGLFFSLGGGETSFREATSESGTHISMNFCALNYIPIAPGTWYSDAILQHLKNGSLKLRSDAAVSKMTIFGKDGYLSRIPVGVIVAYRPILSANLSSKSRTVIENSLGRSGGIGIGPFRIGGDKKGTKREDITNNKDGSFTVVGLGDYPYVLAVISKSLP